MTIKVCLNCGHRFNALDWRCPECRYAPEIMDGYLCHSPHLSRTAEGFNPESFEELANLEAANFWFKARNELIIWALNVYAKDARSFLEVGCGTGFVLAGIADARPSMDLSGSEIFLAGLPYAKTRVPTADLMQMDARQVPFESEFDAIGAFDVLEHIEEDERVLLQLYKALIPGGILFLTVPQHPRLWSAADERACHVRRYTSNELHEKVRQAGFHIQRSTSFVSLLLPAMMLSRRKKTRTPSGDAKENDPRAELSLSSPLNKMFYYIMRFELGLIKMGINFGAGGSRLMVLRKL